MRLKENKGISLVIFTIILVMLVVVAGVIIVYLLNNPLKEKVAIQTPTSIQSNISNNENIKDGNTLKKQFNVTYKEKTVKEIAVGDAKYICIEKVPIIEGVNSYIASKIEKHLNKIYEDTWKDINTQNTDSEIKGILTGINESSPYNIGFTQSYAVILINDSVVTFQHNLDGGIGGVSWAKSTGVSFDINTGDVINIKDIITSKDSYLNICKKEALKQLKNDERFNYLDKGYETVINEEIEKLRGYFTKDGIICAEIEKYEISDGASGEFKFVIPYNLLKDCIQSKYILNSVDSDKEITATADESYKIYLKGLKNNLNNFSKFGEYYDDNLILPEVPVKYMIENNPYGIEKLELKTNGELYIKLSSGIHKIATDILKAGALYCGQGMEVLIYTIDNNGKISYCEIFDQSKKTTVKDINFKELNKIKNIVSIEQAHSSFIIFAIDIEGNMYDLMKIL